MKAFLLIIASFLIGSVPFGVLFARLKGVDLKKAGSGNIGATNVLRTMGKVPALLTLTGDMLKGALAVALAKHFFGDVALAGIAGLSAVTGHCFSAFLGFRGGKGVATSIGVLLVYSPQVGLVTVVVWLAMVLLTRYSSLGALISFWALPLVQHFLDPVKEKTIVAAAITILLTLKHADNIKRLVAGTESKIGKRA